MRCGDRMKVCTMDVASRPCVNGERVYRVCSIQAWFTRLTTKQRLSSEDRGVGWTQGRRLGDGDREYGRIQGRASVN